MKKSITEAVIAVFILLILVSGGYVFYKTSAPLSAKNGNSTSAGSLSSKEAVSGLMAAADKLGKMEPAETGKTLPLSPLLCAPRPASDLIFNVKDMGAKGDGNTDDTKAIQSAMDKAEGSAGTVLVPAGTYLINAETSLKLGNDMTFKMEEGAMLKAIPNDKEVFAVLLVKDVANVTIIGGIIQGDRNFHKGTTGEWGMGIRLSGSKNVTVENVISKDNWGDGFYLANNTVNTKFCGVIADNNRRHGMAIVSADGLVVRNSTFQRGNGYVGGGLDIEPNEGHTVQNYHISHSKFIFNDACGITTSVPEANSGKSFVRNGTIENNIAMHNGKPGSYSAGILVSQQNQIKIINNIVSNNTQNGILVVNNSTENLIARNVLKNNGTAGDKEWGTGIHLEESTGNQVEHNAVSGSARYDIYDEKGRNSLKDNTAAKVYAGRFL